MKGTDVRDLEQVMIVTAKEKSMFNRIPYRLAASLSLSLVALPAAHAQWPVVDQPAIVQLIKQVQIAEKQVQTAETEVATANRALQSMSGDRGMQWLLSGVPRNYLPSNWTQLASVMQGTGGFAGLSADIRNALGANAVLSPQSLAMLSNADQQLIMTVRRSSALQQSLAKESLANASGRFASIQSLIAAISTAKDQKGILDLQARITAELGMLQNEQTKLQILRQATDAQDAVNRQQAREQLIAGHGRFESRFQPVP